MAATLSDRYRVWGITRHQLLVDPRVPYTSHNSSATLHLMEDGNVDLSALADEAQALILDDFQDGSDPGLCVARTIVPEMVQFGQRAKIDVVHQPTARDLASRCGCILRGLGGTQDGVIGALAGIGLAATGEDGRFILLGAMRELNGVQTLQAILDSGISQVRSMDGQTLKDGRVDTGGRLRPACREGQPILFVKLHESDPSLWVQVKLD